jgi:hypothetical protein
MKKLFYTVWIDRTVQIFSNYRAADDARLYKSKAGLIGYKNLADAERAATMTYPAALAEHQHKIKRNLDDAEPIW